MLSRQQLAERLAHLIWRAAPDTTVLAMAQTVQNSAQVADLARFMLADARSEQGLAALTSHWLHPERALSAVAKPEAGSVPASLRASMLRETQLFVTESMRKGASLTDLLTAPHTFANAGLGALYGVTGLPANEHRSVDLDPKQRSGLLTHASALFAHPRATSRGRWIREAFFCLAVPPPPPDVDLKLDTAPGATYRQTLERALDQPQCAACHVILDPPGFALENFDGLGRFRTLDNGLPIDATGKIISAESLEGAFVNGARDLGNKLGGACEVQRCVAQTFLSHALALDLADVNEVAVREVVAGTLAGGGFRLNDLILSVVQSPRFLAP